MPSLLDRLVRRLFSIGSARHQFPFIDPGPLVDGELELVSPHPDRVDDLILSANHPDTLVDEAEPVSREQIMQFLNACPAGHQPPEARTGTVPAYHFWMSLRAVPGFHPPIPIAGGIGLRIGQTEDLEKYLGHIGYHVHAPARGRRLASRAVKLLLPLARHHGLEDVWITCNPENIASRRTIEHAGGRYIDTVPVPPGHSLHARGETHKCRFVLSTR